MSSITLDVSGMRPFNATLNDPARTGVSVGTKVGDQLLVSLGSCTAFQFFLPLSAKLERVKNGTESESIRVTIGDPEAEGMSYESLTVVGTCVGSQYPHATVKAGKQASDDFIRTRELVEVIQERAGLWLPESARS